MFRWLLLEKMSWNHRLMKMKDGEDDFYQFHEVYYDKEGNVESYTKNGITVGGKDIGEVKWVLLEMLAALDKPVLDYEE